jgi:integrase
VPLERLAAELAQRYADRGIETGSMLNRIRRAFAILRDDLEARDTDDINEITLRKFIDHLIVNLPDAAPSWHSMLLAALRVIYVFAVERGYRPSMPEFPSTIPQAPSGSVEPLPRAAVERVLAGLAYGVDYDWRALRLYALAATVYFAGIRFGDAVRLRVRDIGLDAGRIRIPRREHLKKKTPDRASPAVPIRGRLGPILAAWLPHAGEEWAFPNDRGTGPWLSGGPGRSALQQLRAAAREAGVPGVTFDRLYHSHFAHPETPAAAAGRPRAAGKPAADAATGPARKIKPLAPAAAPTPAEAAQLLGWLMERSGAWEFHRLGAFVGLVLFTGPRRQDLIRLRVEHVELDRSRIRIPGRPPMLLSPAAAAMIRHWLARPDRGDSPFVFPGVTLRGPWFGGSRTRHFDGQLATVSRRAGLGRGLSLEDLRRFSRSPAARAELDAALRRIRPPKPDLKGPPTQATRPVSAVSDPHRKPAVELDAGGKSARFRGVREELTDSEFRAVRLLVGRYPETYDLKGMNRDYGSTGWRELLRRLKGRGEHVDSCVLFPADRRRKGQRGGFGIAPKGDD